MQNSFRNRTVACICFVTRFCYKMVAVWNQSHYKKVSCNHIIVWLQISCTMIAMYLFRIINFLHEHKTVTNWLQCFCFETNLNYKIVLCNHIFVWLQISQNCYFFVNYYGYQMVSCYFFVTYYGYKMVLFCFLQLGVAWNAFDIFTHVNSLRHFQTIILSFLHHQNVLLQCCTDKKKFFGQRATDGGPNGVDWGRDPSLSRA